MKKVLLLVPLIAFFVSCTNASYEESMRMEESVEPRTVSTFTDKVTDSHSKTLEFRNAAEFDEALREISLLETEDSKDSLVEARYGQFYSLKKVYDAAMHDAADLDETRKSYMDYKNRYSPYLYFSDYADDCGAYLPVKNKDAAYLLNANGETTISGERVCMRNVTSYADLQEAGVAMYDAEETVATRGWNPSYVSHPEEAFSENSGNVGMEFDSGWWQEGKRKVRVKCGRKIVNRNSPVMKLHVEVSFRKKTWLGWANYSSETTTTGTFTGGYSGSINFHKEADSSHDWYQIITSVQPYQDPLGNPHWLNPQIEGNLTLDYRGIDHLLYLSVNVPEIDAFFRNPTIGPNI
jgi:hypothetical protein